MRMTKTVKEYIRRNVYVTIDRKEPKFVNLHGYLLDVSPEWTLIYNIVDFHLDGYSIIRNSYIERIRHNKYDQFFDRILKKEGIKKRGKKKLSINIRDFRLCLDGLKKQSLNVIVECENKNTDNFHIGFIKKVDDKTISMLTYDACGIFDKDLAIVKLRDVSLVRFGEEYTRIFSKYLMKSQV